MKKIEWATYESGDILDWEDKVDVIGHQVNCFGVMGGGLALQIANKWPEVETEYKRYINSFTDHGLRKYLLGECQVVPIPNSRCSIANLFGQYDMGKGLRTNYHALSKSLDDLRQFIICYELNKLALPVNLGCGLAGGDWNIVQNLIEKCFEGSGIEVILVEYKPI